MLSLVLLLRTISTNMININGGSGDLAGSAVSTDLGVNTSVTIGFFCLFCKPRTYHLLLATSSDPLSTYSLPSNLLTLKSTTQGPQKPQVLGSEILSFDSWWVLGRPGRFRVSAPLTRPTSTFARQRAESVRGSSSFLSGS